ncbi:hypothetical protein, partial [Bacteroides uniformis]|uniref:hypothetical protein n=1 Tax=Bacteroides uniformis TaxID=820 RepID=UPI0032198CE7
SIPSSQTSTIKLNRLITSLYFRILYIREYREVIIYRPNFTEEVTGKKRNNRFTLFRGCI